MIGTKQMIEIPIEEYHQLKEAEQAFLKTVTDTEHYTNIVCESGKITFIDNRDDELLNLNIELDRCKRIIRDFKM